MNVITAVPGWAWAVAAVAVVLAVEFVLWCCCVVAGRADTRAERIIERSGDAMQWKYVRYPVPTGEDTATPDCADTQPTVGA